jgi:hypothetical protein
MSRRLPGFSSGHLERADSTGDHVISLLGHEEAVRVFDKSAKGIDLERFVRDDYRRAVSAVGRIAGTSRGPAAEEAVRSALVTLVREGDDVPCPLGRVTVLASDDDTGSLRVAAIQEEALRDLDQVDEELDLAAAMAGLTLRQRQVATLHYFLDLETGDIATSVGIDDEVAQTELDRATEAFRFALDGDEGGAVDEEADTDVDAEDGGS